MDKLITIQSHWFDAGVVIHDGIAIDVAPIIKYMKGWDELKIIRYCKQRGFKWFIGDNDDSRTRV